MAKRVIRITEEQYQKIRNPKTPRTVKITESQYDMIAELIKKANGRLVDESIEVPIEIGDEILMGKFKNKKVDVKKIGKDELNQPTVNDKKILAARIPKVMPKKD